MKQQPSLAIHYYFDDQHQHTMDAFIKAKADLELLAAMKELTVLFQVRLGVETQALEQGSLIDVFNFVGEFKNAAALIALFGLIFTIYSYRDGQEARELDKTSKRLSNQEKQLQIEKLKQDLLHLQQSQQPTTATKDLAEQVLHHSPKIMARRTQYFKTLLKQRDIAKIGFSSSFSNTSQPIDYVIERENFHRMLMTPQKPTPELYENVLVEVIAPVLKPQRAAKWRGVYEQQEIYFTVTDRQFNQRVYAGQIAFSNGTYLRCHLEIRKRVDETGQESIFSYVVPYVHQIVESAEAQKSPHNQPLSAPKIAQRIAQLSQGDLFNT